MFDELRQKSAQEAEFLNQSDEEVDEAPAENVAVRRPRGARLGLTPPQRFFLALMLFLNVSVLGVFALLAFEKIALPFF